MPVVWDDTEILCVIDESQRDRTGVAGSGMSLMQEIARRHDWQLDHLVDYGTFVRELLLARAAGLLTYQEIRWIDAGPDPTDPNMYLQRIQNLDITTAGRDRAEGREFRRPPPDPEEDDGRIIAASTLEDVARAIGEAYTGTQLERFLSESGIPREWLAPFDGGTKWEYVNSVLVELAEGGTAQRRAVRQFAGSWLDNRLHTGPDAETRDRIARDLGRQGWFVREGRLVFGDPVYPAPQAAAAVARPARLDALHQRIVEVSRQLFEDGHRAAAILQAFVAVNLRVKEISGRRDLDGYDLMAQVFRPAQPLLELADLAEETGRNIQAGYHLIFMGVMAAIRNPNAHELFDHMDEDEALEQLGLASLLMRRLDDAVRVA
ncbi:MAG: hypothetical protein QOH16_1466 [Gaiellaceae bacterium]|nr:hypothetical protein [Gaiellaceae bacterium]